MEKLLKTKTTKTADVTPMSNHTRIRMLVLVAREIAETGHFESYADLKEAVKLRAAALRIPYDADLLARALDRLDRSIGR